jgi:hypothetical protein
VRGRGEREGGRERETVRDEISFTLIYKLSISKC